MKNLGILSNLKPIRILVSDPSHSRMNRQHLIIKMVYQNLWENQQHE
jgi:hypothetical protein